MTKTNRTGMVVAAVVASVLMALTLVSTATGHFYGLTVVLAFLYTKAHAGSGFRGAGPAVQAAVTQIRFSILFHSAYTLQVFLSYKWSAAAGRRTAKNTAGLPGPAFFVPC